MRREIPFDQVGRERLIHEAPAPVSLRTQLHRVLARRERPLQQAARVDESRARLQNSDTVAVMSAC